MRVEHLTIEIIGDVGESVEDACFVGDGVGRYVDVIKVLFLRMIICQIISFAWVIC